MLQGVLSRLGDMENLTPRYTGPRCLLERQAVGGCDACYTTCPHEAIAVGMLGNSITVLPDLCTGCGLCVQVCPSGALEYDLQGPLQAVSDQRSSVTGRPQEDATLTCSQSGAGGPQLPCLGRVTPALVAASGVWDLPLHLIHGECTACPVGAPDVPERLNRVVDEAQRLRATTGQPAQVTVRPATEGDKGRDVQMSRRGAFASLFRAGKQQLVQAIPDQPLPFVDWSVPAERTPEEWRWRERTLKPAPPEDAGVYWPAPLVDDKCINCPVCANVCPTSAITRELQPEGGVQLLLNLSACTGCMACVHSCPPDAMHPQEEWLPAAFRAPILLRESEGML